MGAFSPPVPTGAMAQRPLHRSRSQPPPAPPHPPPSPWPHLLPGLKNWLQPPNRKVFSEAQLPQPIGLAQPSPMEALWNSPPPLRPCLRPLAEAHSESHPPQLSAIG